MIIKEKNVIMYLETTGIDRNSQIISLALICDEEKIYVEFNDYDPTLVGEDLFNNVIKDLLFNQYSEVKTHNQDNNITYIKDRKENIQKEIHDFLLKVSNNGLYNLKFIIDGTLSWFYFINDIFIVNNGTVTIPEFVNIKPLDINAILLLAGINPNISRKEIIEAEGKEINTSITKAQYNKVIIDIMRL